MKKTAFSLALCAATLITAQNPLLAQNLELGQLSGEPSSGQAVESALSIAQVLSDGVVYLGIAALALWGLFLLGSMSEAVKPGATTRSAKTMVFRVSCLLVFASLSLAQCKVIPPADAGYSKITRTVGNEYGASYSQSSFQHSCESVCAGQNTQAPRFIPVCKYCGRYMNSRY
ncbi:MAG: hypothetical protein JNK89_09395 [Saprospiraceae bacterium]|nr:hypothetical protein [Saprospiraceae bacterium]